jgi:hypothetical protein
VTTLAAVVVNYDYAVFLADAVESLLLQEPPFDEVVVVDDGSRDDSLVVARGFGDRVRVVAKDNGGQWSACLAGLHAVTSDYVYFLDADDVAAPGLVAALGPALATAPVKVQFQLSAVDGDLVPLGSVFPTYPAGYDAPRMVQDNAEVGFYVCPPTSANVFSRQALLGLDLSAVDLREFVDGPPAMVMPHLGPVVCLDRPLALYRVHGNNHSITSEGLPALLRSESARFTVRWEQGCALLGLDRPPFDGREPGYLLERRLLLAALGDEPGLTGLVLRYVARCRSLEAPAAQRLALGLWALLLLVPVSRWRARLVGLRRSAVGRPAVLRGVVRVLQTLRQRSST